MAENIRQKLVHLHTPDVKVPQGLLDLGEIAVQHNNEKPALYIRKNNDEIAKFIDESAVDTKIKVETDRAKGAEKTLDDNIKAEKLRAEGIEGALDDKIDALTSAVTDNEKVVATALNQIIESVGLDENGKSLLPGNISLTDAITGVTEKVSTLSGSSHTHANKAELDKIVVGDKAKWDAAEGNAKKYTDDKIAVLKIDCGTY